MGRGPGRGFSPAVRLSHPRRREKGAPSRVSGTNCPFLSTWGLGAPLLSLNPRQSLQLRRRVRIRGSFKPPGSGHTLGPLGRLCGWGDPGRVHRW